MRDANGGRSEVVLSRATKVQPLPKKFEEGTLLVAKELVPSVIELNDLEVASRQSVGDSDN